MIALGQYGLKMYYVHPVVHDHAAKLCCTPYEGHKKGCPNFGKSPTCPPNVRPFEEIINIHDSILAVCLMFDLGAHAEKMKQKHPHWTEKQQYNCLYWQGGMRSTLKKLCEDTIKPGQIYLLLPEAHGVNISETLKNVGLILEWPPKKYVWKVAIIGTANK